MKQRKIKRKRSGSKGSGGAKGFSSLRRAIKYLGHYKREALIAYFALLIATLAQLAVPQMIQSIIDTVTEGFISSQVLRLPEQFQSLALSRLGLTIEEVQNNSENAINAIFIAGALVMLFALLRGIFAFTQSYMGERVSQAVSFDFRNDLFSKIQRLSFSYHDRNQTGQLMIRATDDVEKVRTFIGQGLLLAAQSFVLLIGTLLILFLTNASLTLTILPILPIAIAMFMVFGIVARPLFEVVQEKLSTLNSILQENLAGIKVVKAFNRERNQRKKFDDAAEEYLFENIKVLRIMTFLMPTLFLVANIGQAVILYFGGEQIIEGALTLGEYQKFSLYLIFVFVPIGQLGVIITQMSQAAASASRIFEILDAQSDVTDSPDAAPLPKVQGHLAFEKVTFRYVSSDQPVLNKISFSAEPGETIALLGMTGSGKSTVINLIPRFYDPSKGSIHIDGQDLRKVTLESLRSQIGVVLQESNLFAGTIRDNIAYGRPDASFQQVKQAAKAAAADEFILEFPDGYDTAVGERGSTLSGGQKQRLAIARALLLDPRILILDDSTSSVDLQTEFKIQQALDKLMKGRTSIVIAQRISTVLNADKIIVLDKGEIAAMGNHEELLESSEIYSEIYHSQLMEDSAPDDSDNKGQS
jgi:ATP-binding cassette subfamily B protein